jgi:hypothetical protein
VKLRVIEEIRKASIHLAGRLFLHGRQVLSIFAFADVLFLIKRRGILGRAFTTEKLWLRITAV